MARPPKAKIVERPLGREKAWGQAWKEGEVGHVELDPRIRSERQRLAVLLHELLHLLEPSWGEARVDRSALYLAKALWIQNYRRVRM
jgi:hypothetical protein